MTTFKVYNKQGKLVGGNARTTTTPKPVKVGKDEVAKRFFGKHKDRFSYTDRLHRHILAYLPPVDRVILTKKPEERLFTHRKQYDEVVAELEHNFTYLRTRNWFRGHADRRVKIKQAFRDFEAEGDTYENGSIKRRICYHLEKKYFTTYNLYPGSLRGDKFMKYNKLNSLIFRSVYAHKCERDTPEMEYMSVRKFQTQKNRKTFLLKTINMRMGFEFPTSLKVVDLEKMLMKLE